MGIRNHQFKVDRLSRFLVYILGHRPDEFGLVPDAEGYVTYRELLQALHEEPGWRYVRRSHINEVLMGKDRALFQPEDRRIRVVDRRWRMDPGGAPEYPPGILLTPVRQKAHPVVVEKGLRPPEGRFLVLTPDRDMALRIGKRRDRKPVLMEISVPAAEKRGISFHAFGCLYLCSRIPAECITGPPVSRDMLERRAAEKAATAAPSPPVRKPEPGTFTMDASRDPDRLRRSKGKKRKGWKEASRKIRKGKRR